MNDQGEFALNQENIDQMFTYECPDSLNIALIGKTGAGKSSFINAFRGLSNSSSDAAEESVGPNAQLVEIKNSKFSHRIHNSEIEIDINFFDSMGFNDENDTKIDLFLDKIKSEFKISEFDAIVFVTQGKLSKNELEIARKYESKNVMLFFVYNKIDNYLQDQIRKLTGSFKRNLSLDEQYFKNKEKLDELVQSGINTLCKIIDEQNVFESFLNDMKLYDSKLLKNKNYKDKIIKKSIYLITSNSEDFLNPNYSKDGKRLKNEIENHLITAKLNNYNINLLDVFSQRVIRYKKKYLFSNLFNGIKLKVFGNTMVNIIPFLDTLIGNIPYINAISEEELVNELKKNFLKQFGIYELQEKLRNEPSSISSNETKIIQLKELMKKIQNDEIINNLELLIQNVNNTRSSNIKAKLKDFITKILPSFGIGLANVGDDLIRFLPSISVKIASGLLAILALLTIPLTAAIYFIFLKISFEKILFRYEEYALIIYELLHEND